MTNRIKKTLCKTCLYSGIALGIASLDHQFNIYDIIPYTTGIISSLGILINVSREITSQLEVSLKESSFD